MIRESVFSRNGENIAFLTAEITLYLHWHESQIPGLEEAYYIALDLLQPHVRWYRTEKMALNRAIDQDALRALPFWASAEASRRSEYELRLGSGKTLTSEGPWGLLFYLSKSAPNEYRGFFHLNLPYSFQEDEAEKLLKTTTQLCNVLAFHSGHAGFGIQLDEGDDDPERDQWCYALCRRCSCVDARDLIGTLEILPESIKGIGWITMVNHILLKDIGSKDFIRKTLGREFIFHISKYGLMVAAGSSPVLGDLNSNEDVTLYRKVNQLFLPIRTVSHPCIPGFSQDTTLEWIERFD